MRSTRSEYLSNPDPEIDRFAPADRVFLAVLLAAQGIVFFLLGLIVGWWAWG